MIKLMNKNEDMLEEIKNIKREQKENGERIKEPNRKAKS